MKQRIAGAGSTLLALTLLVIPGISQEKPNPDNNGEQAKSVMPRAKSKANATRTQRKAGGSQQEKTQSSANTKAMATKKPDKASPNLMNKSSKDR